MSSCSCRCLTSFTNFVALPGTFSKFKCRFQAWEQYSRCSLQSHSHSHICIVHHHYKAMFIQLTEISFLSILIRNTCSSRGQLKAMFHLSPSMHSSPASFLQIFTYGTIYLLLSSCPQGLHCDVKVLIDRRHTDTYCSRFRNIHAAKLALVFVSLYSVAGRT